MSDVTIAANLLRAGRLVAFPTETVYGLGADATNADAVRRIFAAKGRPATNPVIVHVADADTARRYAAKWSDVAEKLAGAFWPGPLTLVVPKTSAIPDIVTAGKLTVGLRAPAHPLALELLRAFAGPVAAPSANRSTRVSPTTAGHVRDEFGNAVDRILDGGPCAVGIESTVLDVSGAVPRILRPGAVTREQIESVVGRIDLGSTVTEATVPADAPGQHAIHYAPRTRTLRFEASQVSSIRPQRNGALITISATRPGWFHVVAMPGEPIAYAQQLYAVLRDLDAKNLDAIYVEMPPDEPRWVAIRDRLLRATQPI